MNDCCDDYEDTCNSHTFTECPIPSNPGDDRREDKTKLKIINYNLDWLFLDGRHSMLMKTIYYFDIEFSE